MEFNPIKRLMLRKEYRENQRQIVKLNNKFVHLVHFWDEWTEIQLAEKAEFGKVSKYSIDAKAKIVRNEEKTNREAIDLLDRNEEILKLLWGK